MEGLSVVLKRSELVFLDTLEIRRRWPSIRAALQEYVSRYNSPWVPEDVYVDLMQGKQHLFAPVEGDDGFLIASTSTDARGGVFWIWFAYGPGLGAEYWPCILDLAKTSGASFIAFASPLPMWERHAAKYGFEEVRRIYERRI